MRLAGDLLTAGDSLLTFSRRGRPGREPGTRERMIVRPYFVVYEVADPDHVTILRIWHAAQDR